MNPISRRTSLRQLALAAVSAPLIPRFCSTSLLASELELQPKPTASEETAIAEIAKKHMDLYHVPGLSLAIARHGQLVYRRGFGYANQVDGSAVTPDSQFRIASLSKPITSVAIFSLIEQGRLGLENLIFGGQGLFKSEFGDDCPDWVKKITLHHLLTHTCGGWENDGDDPMFKWPELNHSELIKWTLSHHPLKFEPGVHFAYSNFGYCILGRVIEKITSQPYSEFVQQDVLAKCGIKDMRLAGNTHAQRAPAEVDYYGQTGSGENPYIMNGTRLDSHGGWIATPTDLVQFAMHVDGFMTPPNILRAGTLKTMTTASTANPHYACGWCVNEVPNWWHTGSLPGSLAIMVRTASGLCWAALANTRVSGLELDGMMWQVVKSVPAWNA